MAWALSTPTPPSANIDGPHPPLDLPAVTLDVATLVGVYPAFRGRA